MMQDGSASGTAMDLSVEIRNSVFARLPSDEPRATPVQDSQATKTHAGTKAALGVVYAPESLAREAERPAAVMAGLMTRFCGAEAISGFVVWRGVY